LFVTCANAACQHSTPFTFAALRLKDGDRAAPSLCKHAMRRKRNPSGDGTLTR
jgi:hypothetical protein